MGTVYLGQDESGRRVAVKVINPEYSQHDNFRVRFRREADAARRVRRFCTAAVIDAALDGDQLYVVTEYVEGPNLEQVVERAGPLEGSSLDGLAVGVATALTAIHAAGIIHRDLKPSNVLLSSVGPRVIDFGIARALDTFGGVTHTGELVGTPRYMAPEVLRGEDISPACDVFSWGCLIAYAASGRAPFGGEALPSVIYHVLNNEPVLAGLEPGLRDLVLAALAKDPRQRPTAQQLLDQMVGRVTPESAQHTAVEAWRQGPSFDRTAVANTVANDAADPPRSGRSRMRTIGVVAAAVVLALAGAGYALRLALESGGPPENLPLLYQDDFTNENSSWDGPTYDTSDESVKYGYAPDGFYAVDLDGDDPEQKHKAPIPFVAVQNPSPGPTPTPVTPGTVLMGVDVSTRSAVGSGEYGLYCRGDDESQASQYEFLVTTKGEAHIRRVAKGSGGDVAPPVKLDQAPGAKTMRLEASCQVDGAAVKLSMWVNGGLVQEFTDANGLPPGDLGVLGRVSPHGTAKVKLSFDNFTLRGPGNKG
ncbi:serine/threonine protein kinase [Streptosporangiaceae bacterium NEAU-GS5]|nr:serine/threonine protein kinase [Streptosporangiaceae bacterium NEAU-GS5]